MRNNWLLWFNTICLVCVIHGHILHEPNGWFMNTFGRLVIPLFSLMAGFSWGTFLKKTQGLGFGYGLKIFWQPYLFWSAVYFVLNFVIMDVFVRQAGFGVSIWDGVYFALTGYTALHLWFLITLVYVAVAYVGIFRICKKREWLVVATSLVLLLFTVLPSTPFLDSSNRYIEYVRTWVCWMMPSFSAGILFALPRAKTFTSSHVRRYWAPPLLALGLVVLAIPFTMPGRPVFAAATIFLAALAYPSVYAPKCLAATAPYIMGIYLVHALFTSAFNVALGLGPDHLLPAYFAWPTAIAIFFASWFAVWVMRKIPVVRNLV